MLTWGVRPPRPLPAPDPTPSQLTRQLALLNTFRGAGGGWGQCMKVMEGRGPFPRCLSSRPGSELPSRWQAPKVALLVPQLTGCFLQAVCPSWVQR